MPRTTASATATVTADEDGVNEALIAEHINEYQEPTGEALVGKLADHVTSIWRRGKEIAKLKEVTARRPYPSNLLMRTVEINPEVLPALNRFTTIRDRKYQALQTMTTRALVPLAKLADWAMRPADLDWKAILDTSLDGITLLAALNASTNVICRDAVKEKLGPKCKTLCATEVDNMSPLLLGEDLHTHIRNTNQSTSLFRRARGRGYGGNRFQPYGFSRGYANNTGYRKFRNPSFGEYTHDKSFPFLKNFSVVKARDVTSAQREFSDGARATNHIKEFDVTHVDDVPHTIANEDSSMHVTVDDEELMPSPIFSVSRSGLPEQGPVPRIQQIPTGFRWQNQGSWQSPERLPVTTETDTPVGRYNSQINVQRWSFFKAGRVSSRLHVWKKYTTDRLILTDIAGFKI